MNASSLSLSAPGRYHLCGVAGVGMSAIAQVLIGRGDEVTGSDRDLDQGKDLKTVRQLREAGVRFFPQDGSGVDPGTRALVVSTAIESDNADLAAAARAGVRVMHRAELLAALVNGQRCAAVTGTSGKSTVTGMAGWVLEQLGADPTVVNGASVMNWRTDRRIGNARCGRSDLWIIEADESDRSLLKFHPDWAVITNASKDHFDVEESQRLFLEFARQVKVGLISGLGGEVTLQDFRPGLSAQGCRFTYRDVEFETALVGRHNAENALWAVKLCQALGCTLPDVSAALRTFQGIGRRLEIAGRPAGVTVFDDYAHNPAKIRASWTAIAPYFPAIAAVWRPHGFKPLSSMLGALTETFAEVRRSADTLIIRPVYDAGGTADRSVDAGLLVRALCERGVWAVYCAEDSLAAETAASVVKAGHAVLSMGARDPQLPEFAARIVEAIR